MQDKKKPSKQREVPYTDEGSYKAAKKAYQDSTALYNQGETVKRYVKADKNNFDVKETPISNKNKKLILDANKKEHSKALDIDYSKGSMYEKTPLPYTGNSYRANSEINKNNLYQEMISEHKSDAIAPTKNLSYKRKGAFDFVTGPQEVKSDIVYDKPKTKPVKKYNSGTKKCETGVKKMKLNSYQGGSKKVVIKKSEPMDVSMLKQNVDLSRAVKNNKNTPDGRPMYQDAVRKEAQRRITNDSTTLAKKGYPKYAEGSKGIFSKKRRDDAELEANIIDAGDAIAKQVETPKSTISSVAVTPKKMNLFGRLKRNQEEGNDYAASIDAEDEVIADKNAKSVKVNSTNEDLETGQYSKPKESENEELDRVASSTPQTKTNIVKGADAKLAEWQRKHGLKADGIWGEKSKAKYAELQKSKAPKKMTLSKTTVSKPSRITNAVNTEGKPVPVPATRNYDPDAKKSIENIKDTSFNAKVNSYIPKEEDKKKSMNFNTKAIEISKLHKPTTVSKAPKEKPSPFVTNSTAERKAALKKSPGVGDPLTALDKAIMGEGYERDSNGRITMKKGYKQVNGKTVKTSSITKK